MMNESSRYTGFLFDWFIAPVQKEHLRKSNRITYKGVVGKSNWERYVFKSPVPLKDELDSENDEYNYPLLCRRSGTRFLLFSNGKEIVEYILENEFNELFLPTLKKVKISVDKLVRDVTVEPAFYVLSAAHARIPSYGAILRSASFWGDDLAEANLFRDNMELMNFFSCGLRQAVGGAEIVRLSSEGLISFIFNDANKVFEIEKTFSYLNKEGYLENGLLNDLDN